MRTWCVVAMLVCAAAACDKWDHRLDKMEDFKDRICACDTPACAVNAQRDYETWWADITGKESISGGNIAGAQVTFVAIPETKRARYDELRTAMRECARKAR